MHHDMIIKQGNRTYRSQLLLFDEITYFTKTINLQIFYFSKDFNCIQTSLIDCVSYTPPQSLKITAAIVKRFYENNVLKLLNSFATNIGIGMTIKGNYYMTLFCYNHVVQQRSAFVSLLALGPKTRVQKPFEEHIILNFRRGFF